jgi:ribose/xylose/arabinose/galactoside ABC-type transport system permease subunit
MKALRARLAQHPAGAAAVALVLLLALAALRQPAMLSGRVLLDVLEDGSVLGLIALAATWAILSGGIDLSVGAVMSLASITLAALLEEAGLGPLPAVALVLAGGIVFGAGMGACVHLLELPPFLVTLAGLFGARGLALMVHVEALAIRDPAWTRLAGLGLDLGSWGRLTIVAPLLVLAVALCAWALRQTRFGRDVYALGGSAELARLAGVPIGRTQVGVYATSGLLAASAGVAYALYNGAGNSIAGVGLELDAIAATVVGGASLAGGVGGAFGTLLGVVFFGALQTFLIFEGTLSAGWVRVATGALLLSFLALQRWAVAGAREQEP